LYDLYLGQNYEGLSIEDQLANALHASSLIPANNATILYWEAGIEPDLRFGGSCIDQAAVFMQLCPYPTQLLHGSDFKFPHYAVAVDEGFFDPYWGQEYIQKSGGRATSHTKLYTIDPKWMEGYWRVGYNYSTYYLENGKEKHPTIYVDHFRPYDLGITGAQQQVMNRLNRSNRRFEFNYPGDAGLSDVRINYYLHDQSFNVSIRNVHHEGSCDDSELDVRAGEIEQLYGITLPELQEYFEVAADLAGYDR